MQRRRRVLQCGQQTFQHQLHQPLRKGAKEGVWNTLCKYFMSMQILPTRMQCRQAHLVREQAMHVMGS